jgi:hypothetical protein
MSEHRPADIVFVTGTSVTRISVTASTTVPDRSQRVTFTTVGSPSTSYEIPTWRPLSFGYARGAAFVWSARTLIALPSESNPELTSFEFNEDLLLVFKVGLGWLLVCESSVRLVGDEGAELDRIELGEIVAEAHWQGDTLLVVDVRGFALSVRVEGTRLIQ